MVLEISEHEACLHGNPIIDVPPGRRDGCPASTFRHSVEGACLAEEVGCTSSARGVGPTMVLLEPKSTGAVNPCAAKLPLGQTKDAVTGQSALEEMPQDAEHGCIPHHDALIDSPALPTLGVDQGNERLPERQWHQCGRRGALG